MTEAAYQELEELYDELLPFLEGEYEDSEEAELVASLKERLRSALKLLEEN